LSRGDLIITLAARPKPSAILFDRAFVTAGGLFSHNPDRIGADEVIE